MTTTEVKCVEDFALIYPSKNTLTDHEGSSVGRVASTSANFLQSLRSREWRVGILPSADTRGGGTINKTRDILTWHVYSDTNNFQVCDKIIIFTS